MTLSFVPPNDFVSTLPASRLQNTFSKAITHQTLSVDGDNPEDTETKAVLPRFENNSTGSNEKQTRSTRPNSTITSRPMVESDPFQTNTLSHCLDLFTLSYVSDDDSQSDTDYSSEYMAGTVLGPF